MRSTSAGLLFHDAENKNIGSPVVLGKRRARFRAHRRQSASLRLRL
jgi:hypothetical protein